MASERYHREISEIMARHYGRQAKRDEQQSKKMKVLVEQARKSKEAADRAPGEAILAVLFLAVLVIASYIHL